jgi:hypothetical protein
MRECLALGIDTWSAQLEVVLSGDPVDLLHVKLALARAARIPVVDDDLPEVVGGRVDPLLNAVPVDGQAAGAHTSGQSAAFPVLLGADVALTVW